MFAVEAQGIDPKSPVARGHDLGFLVRIENRTADGALDHDRLHAQFVDAELSLADGLLRSPHGNDGGGNKTVAVAAKEVRMHHVDGPDVGETKLVVRNPPKTQPLRRVEHREIDAEIVEARPQEAWEHGGRTVERVGGGRKPEGRSNCALGLPLFRREAVPSVVLVALHKLDVALDHARAGHLLEVVENDRLDLEEVAVGVNDGMVELRPDLSRRGRPDSFDVRQ